MLPTNVNTLNDKLQDFISDTFLGTKSSWWVKATTVTSDSQIKAFSFSTAVNAFTSVVCRNTATNSSGCS